MSEKHGYRSWLLLGLFFALVCILGALQYRWIGEISQAAQKTLRENLESDLGEISRDFNTELNAACAALAPTGGEVSELGREHAYARRFWQTTTKMFSRAAVAWEQDGQLTLREDGTFLPMEWPASWQGLRERISMRSRGGGPMGATDGALIDWPRFGEFGPPGRGHGPGEQDWLLLEVDPGYIASTVLPELLARHLGANYQTNYQIEVFARSNPAALIYPMSSGDARIDQPDASVPLFSVAPQGPGRGGPGPRGPGRGPGSPNRGPGPGFGPPGDPGRGRWQLSVRPRAGSLDAIVASARRRDLAVSAAILILLLATGVALVRFSRRAQRLAEIEMEFVTGVSHELRTPLTVIRTAAFNLRGRLSGDPGQVERYGSLIQQESEKLTAIVEQVLQFARAKTGRVIQEREPISVERLIEDSFQTWENSPYRVDMQIEPGLPMINGDAIALRRALRNLIDNALKYGGDWVGVFARAVAGPRGTAVELRIADRGPGIPADEQKHIFDAFFRGRKSLRDQIHGTGLGLNLVKKIIEAHGGTVEVQSEPGAGSSFILRIPT
jgi:signal transduction histidine kinase